MESDHILFFGLAVFTLLLYVGLFFPQLKILVKWLKGSRTSYFYFLDKTLLGETVLGTITRSLRSNDDRGGWLQGKSIIEISRGLFRRRSAIYGPAAKNWKLAKAYVNNRGGGVVELRDRQGVVLEDTLRLINTYPSLQVMLERIAELERERLEDKAKIQELSAAIVALYEQILSDRQRYRGAVALELRHDLETIINEADVSASTKLTFFETWKSRFEQNRDLRERVSQGQG